VSGYSEDMTCPYCDFQAAQYNSESRGEGRGETETCDICGYYSYEPKDDYDEYEEEGYPAGEQPPEPAIIPYAKFMAELWHIIWDMDDDEDEFTDELQELLWGGMIYENLANKKAFDIFANKLLEIGAHSKYIQALMK
jgi:hypothetical protein